MYIRSILIQTNNFTVDGHQHRSSRDMNINYSIKYFHYFTFTIQWVRFEWKSAGSLNSSQGAPVLQKLVKLSPCERTMDRLQPTCLFSFRISSEADGKCRLYVKKYHQEEKSTAAVRHKLPNDDFRGLGRTSQRLRWKSISSPSLTSFIKAALVKRHQQAISSPA